jgi:glycosyltransferase involved in cell wall biosynthesis
VRIGIVIPFYNGLPYVIEAVRSALGQLDSDVKIVCVDDGSEDGSADTLGREFRSQIEAGTLQVIRVQNGGVSAARNLGYAALKQDVRAVLFLDSDDVLRQSAVRKLAERLATDDSLGMVFGQVVALDPHGDEMNAGAVHRADREVCGFLRLKRVANRGFVNVRDLLAGNCVTTPGQALLLRASFENAGRWDQDLSGSADWDLWVRMAMHGKVYGISDVVLGYRIHSSGMSRNRRRMRFGGLGMRLKWLRVFPFNLKIYMVYSYLCRIVSRGIAGRKA